MDASEKAADGTVVKRRRQQGSMLLSLRPIVCSRLHVFPKFDSVNQSNPSLRTPVCSSLPSPGQTELRCRIPRPFEGSVTEHFQPRARHTGKHRLHRAETQRVALAHKAGANQSDPYALQRETTPKVPKAPTTAPQSAQRP